MHCVVSLSHQVVSAYFCDLSVTLGDIVRGGQKGGKVRMFLFAVIGDATLVRG